MITEYETKEDVGTDKATSKVDLEFFIREKLKESAIRNKQQIIFFSDVKDHRFEHTITPEEIHATDEEIWSAGEPEWIEAICSQIINELRRQGFDVDSTKIDITVSYKGT